MVELKEAVKSAYEYLQSLQELISSSPLSDVRLEEVELSKDKDFWLITLGFDRPAKVTPLALQLGQSIREYKLLKVNATTGEVEAMLMREV